MNPNIAISSGLSHVTFGAKLIVFHDITIACFHMSIYSVFVCSGRNGLDICVSVAFVAFVMDDCYFPKLSHHRSCSGRLAGSDILLSTWAGIFEALKHRRTQRNEIVRLLLILLQGTGIFVDIEITSCFSSARLGSGYKRFTKGHLSHHLCTNMLILVLGRWDVRRGHCVAVDEKKSRNELTECGCEDSLLLCACEI